MPEGWDRIDPLILNGRRLEAAKAMMEEFSMSLRDTILALHERFEHLRATRPEDFTVSLDDYWHGVYT
ncbi:hypothetical protein [Nocardiopsis sp. FIRDI 009]|uniref:hypothetical protein n=1 Tax=Nocardiopsis sp. FIRDI 009 TaxID=714197 RepID=UPI000E262930|nr:hypothetical protein [Nocardiopsis sp. FIRDI 009]